MNTPDRFASLNFKGLINTASLAEATVKGLVNSVFTKVGAPRTISGHVDDVSLEMVREPNSIEATRWQRSRKGLPRQRAKVCGLGV